MVTCLLGGMKRGFSEPVNFDKIKKVTQENVETLALFQGRLTEAIYKYTNIDPTARERMLS